MLKYCLLKNTKLHQLKNMYHFNYYFGLSNELRVANKITQVMCVAYSCVRLILVIKFYTFQETLLCNLKYTRSSTRPNETK